MGPRLRAEAPCSLAVTGADVPVTLNDAPAPAWTTLALATGDVVKIGAARTGVRGYVAFAAGVEVPPVLGSRATYLRGRLGGLRGRALARDDVLHLQPGPIPRRSVVPLPARPQWGGDSCCASCSGRRPIASPTRAWPPSSARRTRSCRSPDRMGARLNGPRIAHARGHDIVSDGIALGAVQVPGDGQPSCCWWIGNPPAATRRSPPSVPSTSRASVRPSPASACASRPWTSLSPTACSRESDAALTSVALQEMA